MFVWQKNGVVRIIKNGQLLPTPFIDLSVKVNTFDDRGFWGLAFDPHFASNGLVYLSYTFENAGNPNSSGPEPARLTRVTADPANPDVALPGTEMVILGSVGTPPCSALPACADCIAVRRRLPHARVNLQFAADGMLFVGVGDGADGDRRTRCVRRTSTARTARSCGSGTDGTAPSDNPFYDGTNSRRSKVWLYGVRNPFRFTLQPGDRGDLVRRRRLEHLGGGRPRRRRGELRLAVLRGQRPAAGLPEQLPAQCGGLHQRGHAAVPHLQPQRRLRGHRRPVLHGHGLSAAVPRTTSSSPTTRATSSSGWCSTPSISRSRVQTVRHQRPGPGLPHAGTRRDDLLPLVHDR